MTIDEFITKYQNQPVEFDGMYEYQCVDLVQQYNKEVIDAPKLSGNAKEYARNPQPSYYEWKVNTPWLVPLRGSIVVWNEKEGNGFGHCAIVLEASLMKFKSLDQNWDKVPRAVVVEHKYTNVLGFLVPRQRNLNDRYNMLVEDLRALMNKYPKI